MNAPNTVDHAASQPEQHQFKAATAPDTQGSVMHSQLYECWRRRCPRGLLQGRNSAGPWVMR